MTPPPAAAPYSLRAVEQLLGVGRGIVLGLVGAGYVNPQRGARNAMRFSFQDLVLLRAAAHLQSARIPTRKLLSALRQLRERLPAELPLSGLRISAIGGEVTVRQGGAQWEPQSGQLLIDFDMDSDGAIKVVAHEGGGRSAQAWLQQALALEAHDPAGAEAAYRRAIELAPTLAAAQVNLAALLCESGRCDEALVLYEQAALQIPDSALLHFNAAIALEDLQRDGEALACYQRCLQIDSTFADAHFNAARLCERGGNAQGALRHYNAYRRLQRSGAQEP